MEFLLAEDGSNWRGVAEIGRRLAGGGEAWLALAEIGGNWLALAEIGMELRRNWSWVEFDMSSTGVNHTETSPHPEGRRGRGSVTNASGRYEPEQRVALDDGWGSLEAEPPPLRTSASATMPVPVATSRTRSSGDGATARTMALRQRGSWPKLNSAATTGLYAPEMERETANV